MIIEEVEVIDCGIFFGLVWFCSQQICALFLGVQVLIRRKRGKWPIGDARSVDPIRPPACVDRLFSLSVAVVGAASSPFSFVTPMEKFQK